MMQMPMRRSAGERDWSKSWPICGMMLSMKGMQLSWNSRRMDVSALDRWSSRSSSSSFSSCEQDNVTLTHPMA